MGEYCVIFFPLACDAEGLLLVIFEMLFISACVTVDIPLCLSAWQGNRTVFDWLPSVVLLISRNTVEPLIGSLGTLSSGK